MGLVATRGRADDEHDFATDAAFAAAFEQLGRCSEGVFLEFFG